MPLPKIQKVAHTFLDGVLPTRYVDKCGVLIVDNSAPKRFYCNCDPGLKNGEFPLADLGIP